MHGKFIVFEGGEGAGKSTQAKLVASYLRQRSLEVVETREPGGTPLGERLRDAIIMDRMGEHISPVTETLMLYAARVHHVQQVITPALNRGAWVVCDRFTDSTYAYQGQSTMARRMLRDLDNYVLAMPSIVFVLDVPVRMGLKRRHEANTKEGDPLTKFDQKDLEFHSAVRNYYLSKINDTRYVFIDGTQSEHDVSIDIMSTLEGHLGPVTEQDD